MGKRLELGTVACGVMQVSWRWVCRTADIDEERWAGVDKEVTLCMTQGHR